MDRRVVKFYSSAMSQRKPVRGNRFPFDLRSLDVFLAVCEAGTMAGAAKTLKITQPAVSQIIADLEAALSCRLFDRDLRPMSVTLAGLLLRDRARSLLAEASEIMPSFERSHLAKLPRLRVGVLISLVRGFGPFLVSSMMESVSQLSIATGAAGSMTAKLLISRELDVAITVDEFDDLEGLERYRLFTEPYVVIVPKGSELPDSPTVDYLAHTLPLIRCSTRSRMGADIERHLRRMRVEAPRRIEFDEPQGLIDMVASGAGWTIATPLSLSDVHRNMDRVRMIPFPGPSFTRSLILLSRERELGQVPGMICALAKSYIQDKCMPRILQAHPWLAGQLKLEASKRTDPSAARRSGATSR